MALNAVVPEVMRQGWGRIVNVTTSLGTMLAAGSSTYGPSKAALAIHWDPALAPEQAAEKAGASVAWTSIAMMPNPA